MTIWYDSILDISPSSVSVIKQQDTPFAHGRRAEMRGGEILYPIYHGTSHSSILALGWLSSWVLLLYGLHGVVWCSVRAADIRQDSGTSWLGAMGKKCHDDAWTCRHVACYRTIIMTWYDALAMVTFWEVKDMIAGFVNYLVFLFLLSIMVVLYIRTLQVVVRTLGIRHACYSGQLSAS